MTPSDIQTLGKKMEYLRRALRRLSVYRTLSKDQFLLQQDQALATERVLQTALQAIMDSASMIVLFEDWRIMKDEREPLVHLAEHHIISEELAERLLVAKKFRNLLVHEYAEIDSEKVHDNLQSGLADIETFALCLARYLEEHTESS